MVPNEPEKKRLRDSMAVKLLVIGGLILVLLAPLERVRELVREREYRGNQASQEIAGTWGWTQVLAGPVLSIPYRYQGKDEKGKTVTWVTTAHFLPETLKVVGKVSPERRNRGLFEAAVYRADLQVSGTFHHPAFAQWGIDSKDVLWDKASLSVGVPDLRGLRSGIGLAWGERQLQFEPGGAKPGFWGSGLRVAVPDLQQGREGEIYAFSFGLGLNGSQKLQFLPFGKQTTVSLQAPWPSPSFSGAFLPETRRVTGMGFDARWNVSWFARSYPQQWRDEDETSLAPKSSLDNSAFGVDLILPVDAYQKTERSVKYGLLFLVLTFLTFFLYEMFNPFSLHPIQYLLVGAALCLFYLLLLSFSEHIPFGYAYLIGSAATVLLIGGYSIAILRGALRAFLMTLILGVLYGYLYVLLKLEDYALLLGAVGLFLILALVMFLTRRIDWGSPRRARAAATLS
ncbi:MAG TPA: cell envelope integrity protein CreD [Thermoanaerobaculia bacterium]|jgi:inner membrane protein|nr:cell envelope integrity protein CreD [Thermoanaerobaculia bacterium]